MGDITHQSPPAWGIFTRLRVPIPSAMRLRTLVPRLCDLKLSTRDLCFAGVVVSPIWLLLGLFGGDVPMVATSFVVALVSTMRLRPGLAALLRDASAALLPQSLLARLLPRVLVPRRARA
jgi:hypothetical protein